MGLLNSQRMANPTAPNLPQMPPNLPGMGGLPTFRPQPTSGPTMGQGGAFNPPSYGAGARPLPQFQVDLNAIPQYGHGYEGESALGSIGQPLGQMFNFSRIGNVTNLGPNSFAGPPTYGADFPLLGNGGTMNGEMPVTWYAQDWLRNLPK